MRRNGKLVAVGAMTWRTSMSRRTALVTGGVVATVLAATAAMPALAASGAKTVTQNFDAKSSSSPLLFGTSSFVSTDNDVTSGKTIGRDVLSCTNSGSETSGSSHCRVAFAQKGGILYAKFTLEDTTGGLKGTVTGGTGSFAHAKGTLAGQAMSRKDVTITLRYKK
jgi:hypothetical protein